LPQRQPKWRRNPAQRPQQILAAALQVFGEAGVADTTLDEIADRAGVSKGTIYLYFPNKEELFRETVRQALVPAPGTVESQPRASLSPTRQLLDTLSNHWAFLTSPLVLTVRQLVHAEQWRFPELADLYEREVVGKFAGRLVPILRRGVDHGEFRDVEPQVAARMLTALVSHSASSVLTPAASAAVLRELTEFYLQAIAPTEAAFPQADGAPNLPSALNN